MQIDYSPIVHTVEIVVSGVVLIIIGITALQISPRLRGQRRWLIPSGIVSIAAGVGIFLHVGHIV
jgi:hypothetical protein